MKDTKNKKNKKKKWIRFRHRIVKAILWLTLGTYSRIKYGIKIDRLKGSGKRNYLVLSNHQTAFDQFFVGMAFKKHLYYVASEDLFSNGFVSKVIKYLVAPIPIKKATNDVSAVMTCMRVAREGGSIALFPEGNRTYSGKTEYIKPSVAQLAKALKMPIAFFHIEGGYGVHPRWSDKTRRGKMHAYVHSVMEYEDFKAMSNEELYALICERLYVNEGNSLGTYKGKALAKGLERAMYYCPVCGLSEWESHKNTITCKKCGMSVSYNEHKELTGVNTDFPYKYVTEWYDAQNEYIKALDLSALDGKAIYSDTVQLSEVLPYKKKLRISKNAKYTMYNDRFVIEYDSTKSELPFDSVSSMAVLGKNKLNLYVGEQIFQIKGEKSLCALKYINIYYHYVNQKKEATDGEFLGL